MNKESTKLSTSDEVDMTYELEPNNYNSQYNLSKLGEKAQVSYLENFVTEYMLSLKETRPELKIQIRHLSLSKTLAITREKLQPLL